MKIIKNIIVPTGNICIAKGEKGLLEFLSIGDYGKEKNIKADFLGLKNEINGVPHGRLIPLQDKWVITISTQYGCSMGCKFCDVPKVGKGINATYNDLIGQVAEGIKLHPEIKTTKRLNVHYARMGEPSFNFDIFPATAELHKRIKIESGWGFHPVVSTMCPKRNNKLYDFISEWIEIKNALNGEAGLQISVNTTDEFIRQDTFSGNAMPLKEISEMFKNLLSDLDREEQLQGRKYTLNFAISENAPIDAKYLRQLFTPRLFLCKITPMHKTSSCNDNVLITKGGYERYYPYRDIEKELKAEGFDVIVFIPSKEEDESKITCGNAILSDSK